MPEPTQPAEDEASRRFEALWRQAKEGPKTVEVTSTKRIEIDVTPAAILKYFREVADHSHAKGEMKDDDYKLVVERSKEIELAFSGLPVAKLREHVDAVKDRLRAIRQDRGLDRR